MTYLWSRATLQWDALESDKIILAIGIPEFYANLALFHCDLLICKGTVRSSQTGTELKLFKQTSDCAG